jgi:hypothetical protein
LKKITPSFYGGDMPEKKEMMIQIPAKLGKYSKGS